MFAKHFINLIYFIQVAGWNKIIHYMKNEFFTIRNRRSFVGGHFSNRTPSFLLVLFRLWLGAVWVFEGVIKLVDGWMKTPKLDGFFGGATSWFNAILGTGTAATAAADTVSSATTAGGGEAVTGAAASVGKVLFNIDFLGLFRAIFVSGKPLEAGLHFRLRFQARHPADELVCPYRHSG